MKHICPKCNTAMVEAKLDSLAPIRIHKKQDKVGLIGVKSDELSNINQSVCPSCGFIEFYAVAFDKFK